MKKFTYLLMAALFCGSFTAFAQDDEVKVTPAFNDDFEPTFKFDKNCKYYGIYLDDETRGANLTDDQYVYVGPDDNSDRHLDIWAAGETCTFEASPSGNNSFDVPGAYNSLKVLAPAGWSGIGYRIGESQPVDLTGITNEYTFHIALKTSKNTPFIIQLLDGTKKAPLTFGKNGEKYDNNEAVANIERDGEWYNIDIPMSYLEDNFGLSFKKASAFKGDLFEILPGTVSGEILGYDAVFFYGPKNPSTGIKDIQAETQNGAAQYFTVDGKQVTAAQVKATKGLYLVKQNGKTKKVIL